VKRKPKRFAASGAEQVILYQIAIDSRASQNGSMKTASTCCGKRGGNLISITAIDMLAVRRGRMILMAGRDACPPLPVGPFYVKECSLHGFVMFKAHADRNADRPPTT